VETNTHDTPTQIHTTHLQDPNTGCWHVETNT